jgi:acyl-CoA dehydrogenase
VITSRAQSEAVLGTVRRIADEVAGAQADDVDVAARFPSEAMDALREERLLSALVPKALGGEGVPFEVVAAACFELSRRCGATGLIFAMHQIQVATISRHLDDAPWFESYLRDLASGQRLVASATSEVGTGGDMGRSIAAVTSEGDGSCSFEKRAPTVSYGAHADDILTTLRRAPDAEPGDQVIVLTHAHQTTLEPTSTWNSLGMRGTCSPGYVLSARCAPEQVLPTPFARVAAESMVPAAHVLWSHVWLGIATDAFDRARGYVRTLAKQRPDEQPPVAQRLSHLLSELSLLQASVASGLREFVDASDADRERLATMGSALRFNNLKIAASEQAVHLCRGAMSICGIAGYLNGTPYSIGRHLRDSLSAPLMVANDRIHDTNARLLLITKDVY